jgi:S-adenosylmethionine:tRNA ribosyltransferase-isomerase
MDPRALRIADFTYDLPTERIAQHPLEQRDASKLLVYRNGSVTDAHFAELADRLPADSLLVLNNTQVVNARIQLKRATGALIECMLVEPEDGRALEAALQDRGRSQWWCLVGNAKRWKGERLERTTNGSVLWAERKDMVDGRHLVEFGWDDDRAFSEVLVEHGEVPLPPYMQRTVEAADRHRYNTVFAQREGSVAAPTASLHFSQHVLDALRRKAVRMANVTLHVGTGTFLPVKSERMAEHPMHGEQVRIPRTTVQELRDAIGQRPIVPVGTTALRTIESLCWFGDDLLNGADPDHLDVRQWRPYEEGPKDTVEALEAVLRWMDEHMIAEVNGQTSLLIAPGYRFRLAEGLVTNFHQPGSTLLLLVAAFIGDDWRKVYQHALVNDYRFLSYGDGSLLWRKS